MKRSFIAVHDYQHGGVIVRVFASSLCDVAAVLRSPCWRIYEESDPECPNVDGVNLQESDIDDKADWLQEHIYIQDRQAEGKRSFAVRDRRSMPHQYRWLWARSEAEIAAKFPNLEVVWHEVFGQARLESMGTSDIDTNDAFLGSH